MYKHGSVISAVNIQNNKQKTQKNQTLCDEQFQLTVIYELILKTLNIVTQILYAITWW